MKLKRILLFLAIGLIAGCSAMQQPLDSLKAIRSCKFEVKDVKPEIKITQPKLTLKGFEQPKVNIVLHTKIGVTNTTKQDLNLSRMEFSLYVDDNKVTTLDTKNPIKLPAKKETILPADFIIDAKNASETLAKKMKNETVGYLIKGVFYFKVNNMEVPIQMDLKAGRG